MKKSKARLLIGIMYSRDNLLKQILAVLEKKFDSIKDYIEYRFDFTKYYEKEMGKNLRKRIVVFERLIDTDELADIKLLTGKIEDKFRVNRKRKINLDPGYITKKEIVLASLKKRAFKIYLKEGIYAHKVLSLGGNKCMELYHTFPDFRTKKVQEFLIMNRERK